MKQRFNGRDVQVASGAGLTNANQQYYSNIMIKQKQSKSPFQDQRKNMDAGNFAANLYAENVNIKRKNRYLPLASSLE